MYKSTEQALYRAFNVVEMFYQSSPLGDLYRAPDWESHPTMTEAMNKTERIEQDCQTYMSLKKQLASNDFAILQVIYCRSMGVDEWREVLDQLTPCIQNLTGRIKFNRVVYEYICISHLTQNRMKEIYFKTRSIRHNKRLVCGALNTLSDRAHRMATDVLSQNNTTNG